MEIAGIDAATIVDQLMEIERIPLNALESRKSTAQNAADALGSLSNSVLGYLGAAERLSSLSKFDRTSSSVSLPSVVSASTGSGAAVGALSFTVDQLAAAEGLRTVDTVASSSVAITSDSLLAIAAGTRELGVASVRAGTGLAAGDVTLTVSQASSNASTTGAAALAASTVVSGANNTVELTVNGAAHTITIADGTYDADGLATAVQDALDTAGVAATASLTDDGELVLATTREGSAATLQITGGTALADLQLAVDASAHIGTDGIFDVDGTTTTVTSIDAGDSVAVDTGAGTLDVTLSGGLRVGESDVEVVDIGGGSLSEVVTAINTASNGVSAAAVKVADGQWLLQLNATRTGEDGRIAIDQDVFSGLGGFVETSAAQNARITVGSGAGAYSIEASGNTFTDVMGGVTLTAKQVSTDPVTVSVSRDDEAIANDVAKLVSAANDLIGLIRVQTRTDPSAGTKGPLAGNGTVRSVAEQVRSALTDQISGLGYLAADVGIERDRDGGITFDKAKFLEAIADDPDGIARLFTRGGTTSGDAVFASATKTTTSGSYDVVITTAATRASSATLFDGGASSSSRIGVRVGSVTATYDVTAGQSRDEIVDGLNDALAAAGLGVIAEDDGTGLKIRSEAYGSVGDFELNEDVLGVGTWDAVAGTDVAGTIDGVSATGYGRELKLTDTADTPAAGLTVEVAEGATGTSTVEYTAGIAARVAEVAHRLTRSETGVLSTAKESADARIEDFNDQITTLEDRLFTREFNMRRQWANLQTVLSQLQSQGDWLSSQLASLPKVGGA